MLIAQTIRYEDLDALNSQLALLFWGGLLFCLLSLCGLYFLAWWIFNRPDARSPYSKKKMARGSDLTFEAIASLQEFLEVEGMPMFDPQKAAVCRQTGRVFQDAISFWGSITISKSYFNRRFGGRFISWGALSQHEKARILAQHLGQEAALEGFQTKFLSTQKEPWKAEGSYLLEKPGPLLVDPDTYCLLGWKCVPGSDLEVLILKNPQK